MRLEILIEDGDRKVRFGFTPTGRPGHVSVACHAHYYAWYLDGLVTLTPGNITDYSRICDDIERVLPVAARRSDCHDPFQATQLATEPLAKNLPMVEVS